jgi:alkanesulfonate monooxygenase SsuD/methylene tetrahydromethanopterin reductase-like flavin-dependent oxidoreductase (luciferase family)
VSPSERVRDIVDFGAHADAAGLDVFGVGEHRTPRFAVSLPAVVHAAIAARSRSITVTSAVSVPSVLDPVLLYQDFAQLDLVSGGRAEITAGRSAYAEPFEIFGVPMHEYDAVFDEKLHLLLALRRGGTITWAGRYRPPLDDAPIIPQLDRELPVRLGVGGAPESAARASFDEKAAPNGPLVVGSAEEVADKILRQHELLTLDRFLGQVVIALAMRASGLMKVARAPRVVTMMSAAGVTSAQLPLLGALQIAATVGLVAGIWFPLLAIAAAIGLVLYFAGAIIAHVRVRDPAMQGAILFLVLAAVTLTLLILDATTR